MYTTAKLADDIPVTYMGAFRAPETQGFDNALVRAYPNVTNVDMSATIGQVQRVLDLAEAVGAGPITVEGTPRAVIAQRNR